MNLMERIFVQVLSYDLGVKASEYASVYFKLRTRGSCGTSGLLSGALCEKVDVLLGILYCEANRCTSGE